MTKPQKFTAKVNTITQESQTTLRVVLTLEQPAHIEFTAGQFISVSIDDETTRAYSIASSPSHHNKITLLVALRETGRGSAYFSKLKVGDEVTFIGPSGKFSVDKQTAKDIWFLATGTGLAPIISMLQDLHESKYQGKVHLLLGVRTKNDIIGLPELTKIKNEYANFSYNICFSQNNPDTTNPHYLTGRITNYLRHPILSANYYVCGNPNMINDVLRILLEKGVPPENIIIEKY